MAGDLPGSEGNWRACGPRACLDTHEGTQASFMSSMSHRLVRGCGSRDEEYPRASLEYSVHSSMLWSHSHPLSVISSQIQGDRCWLVY